MNTDSKIMRAVKLAPKTDPASPGALASRLADARAAFEAERSAVIQEGTQRMQEIAALQAELAAEQTDLNAVVESAGK